jgi:spermidine synthase
VVAAARQFFRLPEESPRLRIEIADGHDYMAASRRRFDLILVDAFDDKGRSGMLDSIPFYLNCRARLADGGMIAVNFLDRRKGAKAGIERLRSAFDDRVLVLPPSEAGNTVAIAITGAALRESFDDLRAAAVRLKEATGLNLLPTLARLTGSRRGATLLL